jgi:putative multiple sugar transport system ATP-binding protein
MANDLLLEMRGITKTFPGVKALSDVNLEVRKGEIHAICGENGAGKSTLMKVLSGVYPHGNYEGDILFDGEHCDFKDIRSSEDRGIVIIHQELALVPYLSIAENIFLGNEHATKGIISWHETMRSAQALLDRVGLPESPRTRVADIGVGKQQLVEIAKALSKKVKLLILDEPTAALNDEDSRHLLDLILDLRAHGLTCIIISHKLNEVLRVADTITILRDGQTIETMSVERDDITEERIIRGMVGRDLEHRFPERPPHRIADVVFAVEDWTVYHPIDQHRKVVDGVSIDVRRGEVVGIAGLMGAGRTELAMSVFGRSYGKHISGRVIKDGKEIHTRTVSEAIEHGRALPPEHEHQGAVGQSHHGQALWGQSAEGRAQQVDLLGSGRAHPGRADPRHRCRGQVRDLHHHQSAGGAGQGSDRYLLRVARAARPVRPHLHAERGPPHRRGATGTGDAGDSDALHGEGTQLRWPRPGSKPRLARPPPRGSQ